MRRFTAQHDVHLRSTGYRSAFTLIEMLIVLAILGIFAGLAIPSFGSAVQQQRAWAAAERVRADLEWARQSAVASSSSQPVSFTPTGYVLVGLDDLNHPGNGYTIDLSAEPYEATLVSVDFGGDGIVVFDLYGAADSDGQVIIESGASQRTIQLQGGTGNVSVID